MANVNEFVKLSEAYIADKNNRDKLNKLEQIPDKERPKYFKGSNAEEIKAVLDLFSDAIKEDVHNQGFDLSDIEIREGNPSNHTGADIEVFFKGKLVIDVEVKLGGKTDANIGMKTMYSILPELEDKMGYWSLDQRNERKLMIAEVNSILDYQESENAYMYQEVAEWINEHQNTISLEKSRALNEIVVFSGSHLNINRKTRKIRLSLDKRSEVVKEVLDYNPEEIFELSAVATDKRLTIFFTSKEKKITAVFNTKNSVKIKCPDGSILKAPAKSMLGSNSWNLFVSEIN